MYGIAPFIASDVVRFTFVVGTAMRYLLLFFICLTGCSQANQAAKPSGPPASSGRTVTTFEKVIDGNAPKGEVEFVAKLQTTSYGSQSLREAAKDMAAVPFTGTESNTVKFFEIKKNITLPDAANGDRLVIVGSQKDGQFLITEIHRP